MWLNRLVPNCVDIFTAQIKKTKKSYRTIHQLKPFHSIKTKLKSSFILYHFTKKTELM